MLTVDFLIENTDRHYGNFGFIRDVNTLEFTGAAPVFDNGTSLWCEALNTEIGTWQKVMPFKETHKEQCRLINNFNINCNVLAECAEIVNSVLNSSPYLDAERIEKITTAVENRARVLSNIISAKRKKVIKQ